MPDKDGIALLAEYLQILRNGVSFGLDVHKLIRSRKWFRSHKAIDNSAAVKIKEAETAKALGFLLCHCQFPPPIMTIERVDSMGIEFWECPCCSRNSVTIQATNQLGHYETPIPY